MYIKVRLHIFLLLTLLIIIEKSETLFAQQLTKDTIKIKTVEIFADKVAIKAETAGQTTSKIDSLSMRTSMTSSLSELVAKNTPIFIKEYGRGAMATASFRGTAPSHTQVSWNGILLNSPMLGMVDFSMIPVYFTDDVSLLHGAASMKNGSGALGGTVILNNKADWGNRFSGKALSGYGSFSSFDEFIQINGGNGNLQSQTRLFYNYSANDFTFKNKFIADIDPETGQYLYPTQHNSNADYKNYGILQEIYSRPNNSNFLTLRYWGQRNERSIPQLLTNETAENSNINRQKEDAHRATIEWKHYHKKGTLILNGGFNLQQSAYQLKNKISGTSDQTVIDTHSQFAVWNGKVSWNSTFDWITISTGIDANRQTVDAKNLLRNENESSYDVSRWEMSLYGNFSKNIDNKYFINLFLRQELTDGQLRAFLPMVSAEWRPFEQNFYLIGSIAKNYHQPTLNDLYYQPGGNPNLKAEVGLQTDFGFGGAIQYGQWEFNYAVSGYASAIDNWIIWLPTFQGYWEPFNMRRVNSTGTELNLGAKGHWKNLQIRMNGNYAYTRSINRDNPRNWADESIGKQLPYIPLHSANFTLNLSSKGYYATWLWNYYSERFTTSSNDKESEMGVLYPYFMNNFHVGKSIQRDKLTYNIELKINNLFNEDYRTVLQRPMPGRNYSVFFRIDF